MSGWRDWVIVVLGMVALQFGTLWYIDARYPNLLRFSQEIVSGFGALDARVKVLEGRPTK